MGGFDPFNFASRADKAEMTKFREAELKHGRVAMLAVPGFLLSEDFHPFFPDLPKWEFGIFATQDTLELEKFQPVLIASLLAIGAFERGPWTKDNLSADEYASKQLAELNNGRLAMISIFLIVLQELATGVPAELVDDAILLKKGVIDAAL